MYQYFKYFHITYKGWLAARHLLPRLVLVLPFADCWLLVFQIRLLLPSDLRLVRGSDIPGGYLAYFFVLVDHILLKRRCKTTRLFGTFSVHLYLVYQTHLLRLSRIALRLLPPLLARAAPLIS